MRSFKTLTKAEKIWFGIFSAVIMIATFWFSYTGTNYHDWKSIILNWIISPISAWTGVACVILCAEGNINNWWWGLINSITYGAIAWIGGYYGDWMINWFFFIPTSFIIYFVWKNNFANKNLGLVKMKRFTWKSASLVIASGIAATVVLAFFLQKADTWFFKSLARISPFYNIIGVKTGIPLLGPLMDSSTVVFQIIAEILLITCMSEQWIFWAATDVVTVTIWSIIAIGDPTSYAYSIPTLVMWIAFLANSANGLVTWYRGSRKLFTNSGSHK